MFYLLKRLLKVHVIVLCCVFVMVHLVFVLVCSVKYFVKDLFSNFVYKIQCNIMCIIS